MPNSPADEMFRFVECVQHLDDRNAIADQLLRSAKSFGLMNFGISGLPQQGESIEPYFLLSGWPPEWFSRYVARDYVHCDPIIARTRESDSPFTWDEACTGRELTRQARRVMDEATEFRMMNGFTVPIHSVNGLAAVVTFGAETIELGEKDRGALHMIAIYAHNRLRELLPASGANPGKGAGLSSRELDCVQWCAEGKTNWEISVILGLREKTIEAYVRSACAKIGAVNRSHLVAESFRRRLIQ